MASAPGRRRGAGDAPVPRERRSQTRSSGLYEDLSGTPRTVPRGLPVGIGASTVAACARVSFAASTVINTHLSVALRG